MKTSRKLRHAVHGPWGDSAHHLPLIALEEGLEKLAPPRDLGSLELIVVRGDDGRRSTPERAFLSRAAGVPGDAWQRDSPDHKAAQIAIMRADVARLIADEQPLTLFGDNLLVNLDLSVDSLPVGSKLRLGGACLEITPEPHDGCIKFRQRFGGDALRFTADPRYRALRLRGVYAKVVGEGEIAVGDPIVVSERG